MPKQKFFFIIMTVMVLSASAQNNKAKLANEYYQQGEYEKARSVYDEIQNKKTSIPLIHANYLQLLINTGDYKEVEKYLDRVLKYYPTNLQYQVDYIHFLKLTEEKDDMEDAIETLVKMYGDNQYQMGIIAQNMVTHQMYDEAIDFYKAARKTTKRPSAFALDMAAVYRLKNNKPQMTEEYINYAEGNPANLAYVKNLFQNILSEEDDQDYLENTLVNKIQKNPGQSLYAELLIWLELQRKNFYAAFIQAKSLDKRGGNPGDESMRIAMIASDNEAWEDAIDIYSYVIDQYGDSYNYAPARRMLITARENKIKQEYPVDRKAIESLAREYQELYREIGPNPTSLEALRNKALLHAFYLNELDTAAGILNFIIKHPRSPHHLVSESKLDLGDIYLLTGEPWEATLLYSQVEKSNKESPMGYNAKLRNARLNYFTGNFALAKSHLDILKLATTREISNDAIALSLLISDNTVFDTTDQVMQNFADAELLIFQNKDSIAKIRLTQILERNPGHSITDEIYWLQSKLELEAGNYHESVSLLDNIIEGYGYDILSDDAYYKKGVIQHDYLEDYDAALATFTEFLKAHPGSMYAAEARVRIRKLRGDLIN